MAYFMRYVNENKTLPETKKPIGRINKSNIRQLLCDVSLIPSRSDGHPGPYPGGHEFHLRGLQQDIHEN
ncbi:hypothetical protein J1614_009673 [Plenodomus biglobosus]|nr:hypothetical protein J1614_009673 [Plenodomus biglobosus]